MVPVLFLVRQTDPKVFTLNCILLFILTEVLAKFPDYVHIGHPPASASQNGSCTQHHTGDTEPAFHLSLREAILPDTAHYLVLQ